MTVKADITSTLNGQTAELLLVEDSPDGTRKQQSRSLSGGTEALIFTSLDGGRDKRYTAKVIPSTTDVTQTSEIPYGAEIRIDPIPHRDSDATQKIRDGVEFNNGISAGEIGLGNNALVSGLLTAALNDGEVLADDGSVHESVQAAQDAASSYIFIGPGTFNESVTIDTRGLTITGTGYSSRISTTGSTAILLDTRNVTIRDISIENDTSNDAIAPTSNAGYIVVDNIHVIEANEGVNSYTGTEYTSKWDVSNSRFENTGGNAIRVADGRSIIVNNHIDGAGDHGIYGHGDDQVIANNVIQNVASEGIEIVAPDSVCGGNRVINSGDDGIFINNEGPDSIIYNNRISDSGVSDIDDIAAGTVLDSNNTGASN
jgi:hypothetical protein